MATVSTRPMATCHLCGDPLVATFARPYHEFVCVRCGRWYKYLAPKPATPTEALDARHDLLQRIWDASIEDAPSWSAAMSEAQTLLVDADSEVS